MPQAKVLNEKEIRRVLLHVATKKHAARNRAMFTVLNLTGMRVGELASLRLSDVLTSEGEIREEVYLSAQMTKGSRGRTVVLSDKAQEEIKSYLQVRFKLKDLVPVTFTDTSRALFSRSLSGILCLRHSMSKRSIYANESKDRCGGHSGIAAHFV